MTKIEILDDLAYVKSTYIKSMAEEGKNVPLLGGNIGLMWAILSTITLLLHWAIIAKHINISFEYIGFIWMVFGITGGILTTILGKKIDKKPGASSVANRVSSTLWPSISVLIFTYAIAVGISHILAKNTPLLFDTIPAFAFGCHFLAYTLIAKISGQKWMYSFAMIALALVPICMYFLGNTTLYLIATLGVFTVGVIPSLISIKHEPRLDV
ncbi:MAG: hypothetical protein COA43_12090 [Robiginitomaculum sp.]|nr:MAG: hypothetical protein COA43_12090 [Robiginitomaculum sp.]